jgi:hypothetical protein
VDPDAGVVEVWRPGDQRPEIVTEVLTWQVSDDADRLEIGLSDLFEVPRNAESGGENHG